MTGLSKAALDPTKTAAPSRRERRSFPRRFWRFIGTL
jgi:hypothetical protein